VVLASAAVEASTVASLSVRTIDGIPIRFLRGQVSGFGEGAPKTVTPDRP
jgi:hypothetical protein